MAHCKYSHPHPTPLSFGQCPGPTVLTVCVQCLLPTRVVLGVQFTGESAATPKKISLKGSNKHNFIKWNVGVKKKVADSIWHQSEVTLNREGRFAHIRQTRQSPLLKPLMWSESKVSCRKITPLTAKYKSNLCMWPYDWLMGGSGETALTFHQQGF